MFTEIKYNDRLSKALDYFTYLEEDSRDEEWRSYWHSVRCMFEDMIFGTPKVLVDYHAYIKSPEWKLKATHAKRLAGFRCRICDKIGKAHELHAHHRTYIRLGAELPEDITVLCPDCHTLYEFTIKKARGAR